MTPGTDTGESKRSIEREPKRGAIELAVLHVLSWGRHTAMIRAQFADRVERGQRAPEAMRLESESGQARDSTCSKLTLSH